VRKDTRLSPFFSTTSDKKLGGAWERGYCYTVTLVNKHGLSLGSYTPLMVTDALLSVKIPPVPSSQTIMITTQKQGLNGTA